MKHKHFSKSDFRLVLHFRTLARGEQKTIELCEAYFNHRLLEGSICALRGVQAPGSLGVGFTWTSRVHAISLFFVKARAMEANHLPLLSSSNNMGAAHLIYRAVKRSSYRWMVDLFGRDKNYRPMLERCIYFRIIGSRRSKDRNISLFLNTTILPSDRIAIFLDDQEIHRRAELQSIAHVLEEALPEHLYPIYSQTEPCSENELARACA